MKGTPQPPEIMSLPIEFTVGKHAVVVALRARRWTVSVDGAALPATYDTEVEAWEAGVRRADQVDRGGAG